MAATAVVSGSFAKRHRSDFGVRWSVQLARVLPATDDGAAVDSSSAILDELFFNVDFEFSQFGDFDFGFFRPN